MTTMLRAKPVEMIDWLKWIGAIAVMVLIGDAIGVSIDSGLKVLKHNLDLVRHGHGSVSDYNKFVYDRNKGGIVDAMGCNSTSHLGYLIYAYTVVGHYNAEFLSEHRDLVLYFTRNIVNPYENDGHFPLWRTKDWYLGHSLPYDNELNTKYTLAESILNYYCTYLFSMATGRGDDELSNWSRALLSAEIDSLHCYYNRGDDLIALLKPVTLLTSKVNRGTNIHNNDPELMAYRCLSMPKEEAIRTVMNNYGVFLPYGSTWSSILYWILTHS